MTVGDESRDAMHTDALNEKPTTAGLDTNSPITYLNLTFDTELPLPPATLLANHSNDEQLPSCPDLRAYISPLKWSGARKSVLLVLSCVASFMTAYTAGAYSPPAPILAEEFGISRLAVLVGMTTFTLGFALGPMALAPISEIWGRYPIFVIAGIVFVSFQAACSVVTNLAGMLICRFSLGIGASVFSAVVGGVLADLWENHERNTPMALFSGAVLAGTSAGPFVSSALIHTLGETTRAVKWCFWVQVIMNGVLVLSFISFFKESRAPVLLSRKAKKLNDWYDELEKRGVYGLSITGNPASFVSASSSVTSITAIPDEGSTTPLTGTFKALQPQLRRIRWVVKDDEKRAAVAQIISTSIRRPFYLLCTEPVIFCFSLWAAFSWGVLYLSFSVVPYIYGKDFNLSSRVYVAMMIASAVATAVGVAQNSLLKHPQWQCKRDGSSQYTDSKFWAFMRRNFPAEAPEARLYFTCITAMLLPIGLFVAFLGSKDTHGYATAIGLGLATWGIYSVYLATFNYLTDTYHIYASSALAAQSFCRNALGGNFPLITQLMFKNLGIRGAGGMLGAIATALTFIPWILVFFGERIRSKSKVAIVSYNLTPGSRVCGDVKNSSRPIW